MHNFVEFGQQQFRQTDAEQQRHPDNQKCFDHKLAEQPAAIGTEHLAHPDFPGTLQRPRNGKIGVINTRQRQNRQRNPDENKCITIHSGEFVVHIFQRHQFESDLLDGIFGKKFIDKRGEFGFQCCRISARPKLHKAEKERAAPTAVAYKIDVHRVFPRDNHIVIESGIHRNFAEHAGDRVIVGFANLQGFADGILATEIFFSHFLRYDDRTFLAECRMQIAFCQRKTEHLKKSRIGEINFFAEAFVADLHPFAH